MIDGGIVATAITGAVTIGGAIFGGFLKLRDTIDSKNKETQEELTKVKDAVAKVNENCGSIRTEVGILSGRMAGYEMVITRLDGSVATINKSVMNLILEHNGGDRK